MKLALYLVCFFLLISCKNNHDNGLLKKAKEIHERIIILDTHNDIDVKNFIGWPIESKLGGFCAWDKLDADKHFKSEIDRHPNRQGQEIIAELIYENL